jgi:N-acetylmuramate 1-kinase
MNSLADSRICAMTQWLGSLRRLNLRLDSLVPASADASFRRYFRVLDMAGQTYVVMDAPPAREDCKPYVKIAEALNRAGIFVPVIHRKDLGQGFLLLSDLGGTTYKMRIDAGVSEPESRELYSAAIETIIQMQKKGPSWVPRYSLAALRSELDLFSEWYAWKHCGLPGAFVPDTVVNLFDTLARGMDAQTCCFVHRDFHSPNLMVPAGQGLGPGVLDFQDAVSGPITYDLVSLVADARVTVTADRQHEHIERYWRRAREEKLPVSSSFMEFHAQCDWTSIQRNLRILGVLARLFHRDGRAEYLEHIPRVAAYVREAAKRQVMFSPIVDFLNLLDQRKICQ